MLGELERRADPVGQRDPVGRRGAEDMQDELADRVRREVAVGEELVVGQVRDGLLVPPVRLDQPCERGAGQSELAHRRPEPAQDGMFGLGPVEDPVEVGLEGSEEPEPVAGGGIADLVDEPRVAVDREQVAARRFPQDDRGDREVLAGGAVVDLPCTGQVGDCGVGHRAILPVRGRAARDQQL